MEKTLFPASMTSFDLINDYFKPSQQFSSSSIQVSMSAVPDGDIRYTKDGTPPLTSSTKYSNPITVNSDLLIMSALFKDGEQIGNINRILFQKVPQDRTNLTYGKPVTSNKPYFYTLPPRAAVDGAIEINSYWSAYTPPAEWNSNKAWITIDLERTYSLDKITVFAGKPRDDVYEEYYKVDISTDNSSWTSVANNVTNTAGTNGVEHSFSAKDARYIRLTSTGNNMFPEGHYSRIIEIRASGSNTKKPALVAYNGRTLLEKKPPLRCYRLSGANSYKVMYADNKGFTNAVTKDMTDTVYTPDSDLNTGMWYWKASSNLDFDNYSAVDSFIVETMTSVGPSVQTAKSHVTFLNTQKGVRIFIDGFKGGNAVLNIFDLKGRLITALKSSDIHSGVMFWDHRNKQGSWVGSGIYILRLTVNNSVYMHRIVLNR